MEKRKADEEKAAKRAAEKLKRQAALKAKRAAAGGGDSPSGGGGAGAVFNESVFDQLKKAQAGNASDIVSRFKLRQRDKPDAPKASAGAVNNELAALLARRRG